MSTLGASSGIHAADALHLACAERAAARRIATLDGVMARNAERMGLGVALAG